MKLYGWVLVFFFLFAFVTLGFFAIVISETSISEEEYNKVVESEQYYKTECERILNENSELEEKVKEEKAKYNEVVNSSSYKRALYAEELEKIISEAEKSIIEYQTTLEELENLYSTMEEKREKWKTQPLSFCAGEYICGMDFPDGRYLIYDGDSNFCVYDDNGRLDVNIILGDDPDWGDVKEYLHFFEPGEIIQSDSPFKLKLVE